MTRGEKRAQVVEQMHEAIRAESWQQAAKLADQLRFNFGWNYARMAQEFGGTERWEEIAQAIDDAESGREDSDDSDE